MVDYMAEPCPKCNGEFEYPFLGLGCYCGLCENKGTVTVARVIEVYENIVRAQSEEILKLMDESPYSLARILDEHDCQDQLEYTPIHNTVLADLVKRRGCCHIPQNQ